MFSKLSEWFYRALYALLVRPILRIHAREYNQPTYFELAEEVLKFNRREGNVVLRTGTTHPDSADYAATLCEPCKGKGRDAPYVSVVNGIRLCRRHDNVARLLARTA